MERITIDQMPEVKNEECLRHLNRYVIFINSRPERDLRQNGFHTHHIYPKSIAKVNNIEDFDGDWNLVELTPREHFIAHMILYKCGYIKMVQAFWYMSKIKKYNSRLSSRQYEKLEIEKRQILSEINTGTICINNGEYNVRIRPDQRIPSGFKLGFLSSVDLNGTVWINNGLVCKQVKPNEIPEGWELGMLDERMWVNNGAENRLIKVDEEAPGGFVKGRLSIGYWIHNDFEEKYTNTDLIPDGYEIGRLLKTTKGTIWYTNGIENKMIKSEKDIPDGFYKGTTKEIPKHRLITNGKTNKYLLENDTIPNGWRFGTTINMKNKYWITNGVESIRWDLNNKIPYGWKRGKTVSGFFITNGVEAKLVKSGEEIPFGWRKGRLKRTKEQIKKDLTI